MDVVLEKRPLTIVTSPDVPIEWMTQEINQTSTDRATVVIEDNYITVRMCEDEDVTIIRSDHPGSYRSSTSETFIPFTVTIMCEQRFVHI